MRSTKDGVLVLFHDDDMLRMTGVPGMISDYTYNEISQLDVIGGVNNDVIDSIMTFEQFLERYSHRNLAFSIEIKQDGIEKQIIDMLNKYNMQKAKTSIISFNIEHLRNVRKYTKDYNLGYLIKEYTTSIDDEMSELGMTLISPRTKIILDKDVVLYMHSKGYTVQSWGAYIEKSIRLTYDLGVDAMVVDQPDILIKYINEIHNTKGGEIE